MIFHFRICLQLASTIFQVPEIPNGFRNGFAKPAKTKVFQLIVLTFQKLNDEISPDRRTTFSSAFARQRTGSTCHPL